MSAALGLIEIFVGEVGSGKSLVAVGGRIIPHLVRGGIVCTNIPLKLDPWHSDGFNRDYVGLRKVLKDRFSWDLQDGQIITLPRDCFDKVHHLIPAGTPSNPVLLVLDEVLEGFDSMDRNDNATRLRDVLSFIRHCRHLSVNLVLILQTFAELNNRVRTKASKIWLLRDTNKMRVPVIRCPFPIRNMILAQWWNTKGTELFEQHWISKSPWIFACYDTLDMTLSTVRCGLGQGFDFRGKGKVTKGEKMTKLEKCLVGCVGAVAVVAVFLSVRSVQAVDDMQSKVVGLNRKIAVYESAPVSLASSPVSNVLGKVSESVSTNEPLRVCAVVNGRVGLSSGRWVRVGDSDSEFGLLLDCDPSRGRSSWSKNLVQIDRFCD